MMKHSFQETKNSNFLYYGIILVSVLLEVIMVWQLERLIPLIQVLSAFQSFMYSTICFYS